MNESREYGHERKPRYHGEAKHEDKLEEAKEQGEIERIRTIKPNKNTYIHVGVTKHKGKRGGRTIAGKVHHEGEKVNKRLVKGSKEAKAFMDKIRKKRGKKHGSARRRKPHTRK